MVHTHAVCPGSPTSTYAAVALGGGGSKVKFGRVGFSSAPAPHPAQLTDPGFGLCPHVTIPRAEPVPSSLASLDQGPWT